MAQASDFMSTPSPEEKIKALLRTYGVLLAATVLAYVLLMWIVFYCPDSGFWWPIEMAALVLGIAPLLAIGLFIAPLLASLWLWRLRIRSLAWASAAVVACLLLVALLVSVSGGNCHASFVRF